MRGPIRTWHFHAGLLLCILMAVCPAHARQAVRLSVDWSKKIAVSQSVPTLQVVVNPMLRRGSPIHDRAFSALKALGADFVRFVPWYPYPKLAVAELAPPHDGRTSWDFSLIDPLVADFLDATRGHPAILNFSTQPAWMFKTGKPAPDPADPDRVDWTYSAATTGLTDPSGMQLARYYQRLVSWYTKGGFTDEYGRFHKSGHHYALPWWEVFNEIEYEHRLTPEQYTRLYDAIVGAIRKVSPSTKFIGLALGAPNAAMLEYFLNHKNHAPGIPLDMISYHFYARPAPAAPADRWQNYFFGEADRFVADVKGFEDIRKRLSPATATAIDEIGTVLPDAAMNRNPAPIPAAYWNLSAATYAYLFAKLSVLGIDVLAESQLVGYPTQFPSATMIDWTTGKPNARYRVLKLLIDNFKPGDVLVDSGLANPSSGPAGAAMDPPIAVQGYRSSDGTRRLLLINKRNRDLEISLPRNAVGGRMEVVDTTTADRPARTSRLSAQSVTLAPFAVAVITLP